MTKDSRAQLDDLQKSLEWLPISSAPSETWVEVCGPSGMISPAYFIAIAMKMIKYRPLDPWRDITRSALSDNSWTPMFWRSRQPLPALKLEPLPPGNYIGKFAIDNDGNVNVILDDGGTFRAGKLP